MGLQPGDGIGQPGRPPRDYPFRRSRNAVIKLQSEIRKRISRIEFSFGLDGFEAMADVKFINGVQRGIILDGERVLLLHIEGSL